MSQHFKRGIEFPNEGFVQKSIETHFFDSGFQPVDAGYTDLSCSHPETGEEWHIEAKGLTSSVGLDFRTGLGQLVQGMTDESVKYGLAVPNIPQYEIQCSRVRPWVRQRLGLHWILVNSDGNIRVIGPED